MSFQPWNQMKPGEFVTLAGVVGEVHFQVADSRVDICQHFPIGRAERLLDIIERGLRIFLRMSASSLSSTFAGGNPALGERKSHCRLRPPHAVLMSSTCSA